MISYENVILIIIATVLISAIISGMYYARRTHRKVSYILDALEDKETNFRFDENKLLYRKFNKTLNRIRLIFEKEKQEINEQERYYGQMLDRVKTGYTWSCHTQQYTPTGKCQSGDTGML